MPSTPALRVLPLISIAVAIWAVRPLLAADEPAAETSATPIVKPERAEPVDFEHEILPILRQNCLACHSTAEAESDLVLETPQAILTGGYSGAAVEVETPEESLLLLYASGELDPLMPPADNRVGARRLTSEELGLIQLWIEQGAKGEVSSSAAQMQWQPLPVGVNPIYAIAATDDAQFVACGRANQIFIYHLPTSQSIDRLTDPALLSAGLYDQPGVAHRDLVQSLAFSPEGYMLASGGYRVVKLWQRPRDVQLLNLAAAESALHAAAVSADGAWLATASDDNQIHLWHLPQGEPGPVLAGHTAPVHGLSFQADGSRLASVSRDSTLRVWNLPDGQSQGVIAAPSVLNDVSWTADGSRLVTAGADHLIRTWSPPAAPVEPILAFDPPITAAAASPHASHLAWSTSDGTLRLRDVAQPDSIQTLSDAGAPYVALNFSTDGQRLVARDDSGRARLFDVSNGQSIADYVDTPAQVTATLPTSEGQLLLGDSRGLLVAWDAVPSAGRQLEPVGDAPASLLHLSPDGRLLASDTTIDGQPAVLIREFATRDILARLVGHASALLDVSFNADGTRLVSTSTDGTIILWDTASGSPLVRFAELSSPPTRAAFVNADQFATAHHDGQVRIWQSSDGSEVRTLDQLAGHEIVSLSVSRDHASLAAATRQGAFRVWSAANGELQATVDSSLSTDRAAINSTLTCVALVGTDRTLRLVARDGSTVEVPELAQAPIHSLAFTPDENRVVAGCLDRRVAVVDRSSGRVIEQHQAPGDLSALTVVPSSNDLLVATTDRRLHSHTIRANRLLYAATAPISTVTAAADSSRIILGTRDGQAISIDPADRTATSLAKFESPIATLCLNADASLLAVATDDRAVQLIRIADQQSPLPAPLGGLDHVAAWLGFSGDGRFIFAAEPQGQVRAWRLADGQPVEHLSASGVVGLYPQDTGVLVASPNQITSWNPAADQIIAGHSAPITSLALLPDGAHLLSGSEDGTVRQWELASGNQVRQLDHGGPVTDVAVRPDGQRIASAGANRTVRLWNGADGAQVAEIKGDYTAQIQLARREKAETRLKADLDASTQAVADAEKDLAAKQETVKTTAEALIAAAQAMTTAADAAKTAETAKTEAIALAQAAAEKAKAAAEAKTAADALAAKTAEIAALATDAATSSQATATSLEQALASARESAAKFATALEKSPEDQELVAAKQRADQAVAGSEASLASLQPTVAADQQLAQNRMTAATDAATAQAAATEQAAQADAASKTAAEQQAAAEKAATEAVAAAKEATDKHSAAEKSARAAENAVKSATDTLARNQATVADVTQRHAQATTVLTTARETAAAHELPLRAVAFSPDNRYLVTAGDDPLIHEYLADDARPQETYAGHRQSIGSVFYLPQGHLLSAATDGSAKLWQRLGPWQLAGQLGPAADDPLDVTNSPLIDRVLAVAFSPDGRYLAVGGGEPSRNGQLQIWDLHERALVREIDDAHSDTVFGLAFSPDGRFLASCAADKFVKVFDAASGEVVRSFEGHTHHVLGVSWSPDAKLLASCGADQVIKLWNFDTGEQQRTISGFGKQVTSVTFVGETGATLSTSGDKTVRLHNVSDGKNTRNFAGGTDFMNTATTTPDGQLIIAAGQDSTLRTWNAADGKPLQTFAPPTADNEQAKK